MLNFVFRRFILSSRGIQVFLLGAWSFSCSTMSPSGQSTPEANCNSQTAGVPRKAQIFVAAP